jgi:hypothetical protein
MSAAAFAPAPRNYCLNAAPIASNAAAVWIAVGQSTGCGCGTTNRTVAPHLIGNRGA